MDRLARESTRRSPTLARVAPTAVARELRAELERPGNLMLVRRHLARDEQTLERSGQRASGKWPSRCDAQCVPIQNAERCVDTAVRALR